MPCAASKPSPRIRFTDGEIGLIGNLNGWEVSGVADFSPEELEKESSRKVTSECLNYLKEFREPLRGCFQESTFSSCSIISVTKTKGFLFVCFSGLEQMLKFYHELTS